MNKSYSTIKDCLIKPALITGIVALSGCVDAKATQEMKKYSQDDQYSFSKVGTRIILPDCDPLFEGGKTVTAIYSTDLDGDGQPELIIGTKRCGVYILKNNVLQKQIGE